MNDQEKNDNNKVIFKWKAPPNMNNSSEACIISMPHKAEVPLILSGWLFKMRRTHSFLTPTWDKRWVVIQNDSISWRHSQSSEVAGSIDLCHVESIHKVPSLKKANVKKGNKNEDVDRIFVIKSKKRVLCLMTTSSKVGCEKWVRALELQMDLKEGGTFTGPKNEKNRRKSNGGGDKYDLMMKSLDQSLTALSSISKNEYSLENSPTSSTSPLGQSIRFESLRFSSRSKKLETDLLDDLPIESSSSSVDQLLQLNVKGKERRSVDNSDFETKVFV